ncbi:hypothetical protein FRX31_008387 [Thalictrum thalictroides]|uniref:Uncharacterized protein n=1 Tax=Thalictrum thalictroides TaxID=46969 RepID=A0A7J6WX47_THATH|nr:hypothetical protein FRX31_008387 [Thalictrum thalictroides]
MRNDDGCWTCQSGCRVVSIGLGSRLVSIGLGGMLGVEFGGRVRQFRVQDDVLSSRSGSSVIWVYTAFRTMQL